MEKTKKGFFKWANKKKNKVKFVPDKNGDILISTHGMSLDTSKYIIGIDPYKEQ